MPERKEQREKHGVVFGIWDGQHIQLEKRIKSGKLQGFIIIPGGGVEDDETLGEALFREVGEEYGVVVKRYRKLGIFPSIEDDGVLNVRHLYLITNWSGTLSNPEGDSQHEHIEATIEEAYTLCKHPLSQIFLQRIKEELSR